LEHVFFTYIGNFILPTDELIFFKGVGQPPTSYVNIKPFIMGLDISPLPLGIPNAVGWFSGGGARGIILSSKGWSSFGA